TGTLLHAAEHREPTPFAGRRVVVLGLGNSAVQIAAELAGVARVTLAGRGRIRWTPQRPLGRDLHHWLGTTGLDSLPVGPLLRTPPRGPATRRRGRKTPGSPAGWENRPRIVGGGG
ncbi:hypothetical protein FNQ90_17130, partial [Streptomyces alkaliphilus]|nr:hypothetical protein [Streptomyces alkaliphilus]